MAVRFLLIALLLAGCVSVSEDASGQELYASLCARCHGSNLEGGIGPRLGGPEAPSAGESDEYLRTTISRGKGRMPAFGSLSEDQIERLVVYIREQQSG